MRELKILSAQSIAGWTTRLCIEASHGVTQSNREVNSSLTKKPMELIEPSQKRDLLLWNHLCLDRSRLVTLSRLAITNASVEGMAPLKKSTWKSKNLFGQCLPRKNYLYLGVMLAKPSLWSIERPSITSVTSARNVLVDHFDPYCPNQPNRQNK